jgi:hypothetical protein
VFVAWPIAKMPAVRQDIEGPAHGRARPSARARRARPQRRRRPPLRRNGCKEFAVRRRLGSWQHASCPERCWENLALATRAVCEGIVTLPQRSAHRGTVVLFRAERRQCQCARFFANWRPSAKPVLLSASSVASAVSAACVVAVKHAHIVTKL